MEYVTLHNGVKMPQLGYGVYLMPDFTIALPTSSSLK